ncbi:ead/Ea22-like family protein [Escherichia coli]
MERLLMLPADDDLLSEQELKDYGVEIDALNAFKFLAGPETVLALLDERERNQQYIKRRDQENEDIALTVGKLRVELEETKSKFNEQREYYEGVISDGSKRIAELEKSEEQLINERDHAESALADMYFAATGDRPEWSNWFGFSDAVDAVIDRIADLEAKQPSPVVPEEATPDSIEILASARRRDHAVFQWDEDQRNAAADSWNAFRAAMRQELKKSAGTEAICRSDENVQVLHTKSPAQSDCCPAQNQGWIPISDRMPEDEQEVLTINKMGHRFVSFFDKHSGLFFDRLDAPAACCIEHVLVTHWMPLPAAPQEVR